MVRHAAGYMEDYPCQVNSTGTTNMVNAPRPSGKKHGRAGIN